MVHNRVYTSDLEAWAAGEDGIFLVEGYHGEGPGDPDTVVVTFCGFELRAYELDDSTIFHAAYMRQEDGWHVVKFKGEDLEPFVLGTLQHHRFESFLDRGPGVVGYRRTDSRRCQEATA